MSECVVQVQVPIYRLNAIHRNVVIGPNTYYGGCTSYIHSNDCKNRYTNTGNVEESKVI